MESLDMNVCEGASGGMARLAQYVGFAILDRMWADADRAAAAPGTTFESTPFLDALAARNMGA